MSWQRRTNASPTFALAPGWFAQAKERGANDAALRALVREHCTALLIQEGKDEEPSNLWVELLFQMYDNGCQDC